jgi:hypothetical protein
MFNTHHYNYRYHRAISASHKKCLLFLPSLRSSRPCRLARQSRQKSLPHALDPARSHCINRHVSTALMLPATLNLSSAAPHTRSRKRNRWTHHTHHRDCAAVNVTLRDNSPHYTQHHNFQNSGCTVAQVGHTTQSTHEHDQEK